MVVPISITASKSGSDPSSSQNPEKHENVKPLPAVDATSMLMDESHGPEFCPYDDRKLEKEHVPDNGQTFAANPPCVGPQHVPHMLWMQQPLYPVAFEPNFVLRDKKDICDTRDKIAYQRFEFDRIHRMEQFISDLKGELQKGEDQLREMDQIKSEMERELEKEKGEVCAKVSSLKEKEAELATCRQNLDHCETENRRLEEKHRASLVSIICDNERLNMERARCVAWNHEQSIAIQSLQGQLEACAVQINQLLFDCQRQSAEVERYKRLARQLQRELANARERTQTHPDESRIPLLSTQSGNASIQAALEVSQISALSQTDQNLTRSDAECEHDTSVDGQALHSGNLAVHVSQETIPDSVISPSAGEEQVISQENDTNTILVCWGSTGLTSEIRLDTTGQNNDAKEQ